jgi:hypothetical protein
MATQTFSGLDPAIKELEFKVTVLRGEESKLQAELKRLRVRPVRRRVYFYDTRGLDLAEQKLYLRGRETEGDDEDQSTVKLRPLPDAGVPAHWLATEDIELSADVVGSEQVPSVKLDRDLDLDSVAQAASRTLELSKLFSKEQEAIIEAALPDGTELDDLEVFGPIHARKWDLPADVLPPYELSVEEWSLPDASRFLEISFKTQRVNGARAQQAFHGLLDRLKIGHDGDPDPKTLNALEFFAAQTRPG